MNPAHRAVGLLLSLTCGAALAQSLPYRSETCSDNGRVCLIIEQKDTEQAAISIRTSADAELTLTLDADVENVAPSTPLPVTVTLEGSERRTVVRFKRARRELAWTYRNLRYTWNWGRPRTKHDPTARYQLPFEPGTAVRVIQAYGGTFSHDGDSRYAVDFDLPEGTPVRAARAGVVVDAVHTYKTGGTDGSFLGVDKANRVVVRHDDGTFGYYGHLKPGGIFVREKQRVSAGQLLGLSGNTGYTKGPHLHFEVRGARDGRHWETFPVRFDTAQGQGLTLEQDKRYSATR